MYSNLDRKLFLFNRLIDVRAFWSYDNPVFEQISDVVLIENVLTMLDSDDILLLIKIYPMFV